MTDLKKTILLVEDEAIIAITEKKSLEKYGYNIITAQSGEKALDAVEKSPEIDLILMDINLGDGIDGTEAAEIILAKHDLPLIFLSSHSERDIVEKTEGITSYGYVVKNSGITVLDASIKMAFKLFDSLKNEKKKENDLRKSERNYRDIFDNALEGIFRTSPQGKFIQANNALAAMLGYASSEDLVNSTTDIADQVWFDQDERMRFIELLEKQNNALNYRTQFKRRDGSIIWVSLNSRIVRNHKSNNIYYDGFIQDITEHIKADLALSGLQTLQNAIVDSTSDLIWSVDPENFGLQTFNSALADYFLNVRGTTIKIGDRPEDLYPPGEYVDRYHEMYKKVLSDGPYTREHIVYNGALTLEMNFNLLKQNGKVFGISVFGKNITARKKRDEALKRSEEKFSKAFNSSPNICTISHIDSSRMIEVNESFIKMLEFTREEAIGRTTFELGIWVNPADREHLLQVLRNNGSVRNEELKFRSKSGAVLDCLYSSELIEIDGEKHAFSVIENITERKQTEEALRKSEKLYRKTFDAVDDYINIIDRNFGLILYNDAYSRSLADLGITDIKPGVDIFELCPFLPDKVRQEFESVFDTGTPLFTEESFFIGGSQRWSETHKIPIKDQDGKTYKIVTVIHDVTENKKSELEIIAAKEQAEENGIRFKAISEQAMDGIALADMKGNYIFVNLAFCRMVGYTEEELIRMNVFDLKVPDDNSETFKGIIYQGEKSVLRKKLLCKDKSTITADINGKVTLINGQEMVIGIMRDVTKQVELENEIIAAKEKAEASELRLKGMLDNMLDAFFQADINGIFTYANPAALRMYRYSSLDEIIGIPASTLYAIKEERDELVEELKKSGIKLDWNCKGLRKDGTTFWVSMNIQVIRDKNGNVIGTQGVTRDITERKLAEEALRESETRYKLLFDAIPESVLLIGTDRRVVTANHASALLYGYESPQQLEGFDTRLLIAERDRERAAQIQTNILQGAERPSRQYIEVRRDGSEFVAEVMSTTLLGPQNEVTGYIGITRDITKRLQTEQELQIYREHLEQMVSDRTAKLELEIIERKKTEELLTDSEKKYRNIVNNSASIILEWDPDGTVLFINQYGLELFGFREEEIIGRNVMETIVEPVDSTGYDLQDKMQNVQKNPEDYYSSENENICKNGKKIWVAWTNKGIRSHDGRLIKTLSIGVDRTQMKQLEEELKQVTELNVLNQRLKQEIGDRTRAEEKILKSLREKELLIRELYHRTKNTIQVIRGMIVLQAVGYSGNREIQELVKNTEDRIQAISLVHQMLYQSQDLSQISIKEYIQNLSVSIIESYSISSDKIIFNFNIDEQSFLLDTAIPLGLIINELITNSIKYAFTDHRKGTIKISLTKDESGNNIMQYSDNGVGTPVNFDFRNSSTLGLKLIHSIGEDQMLGTITMENNNGIRVSFIFPDNLYKARV